LASLDEENRANYKYLYNSKHKNVTGIAGARSGSVFEDPQLQRTESFQDHLDYSEFKKEQMSKKKAQKLATTQKIFNRKYLFSKKKEPSAVAASKEGIQPKEGIQQLRRAEMQQKA